MVSTKIALVGFAIGVSILIIFGIVSGIYDDWYGGLRIENLPNEIKVTNLDKPQIPVTFRNYGSEEIQNIEIITNTTKPTQGYLQTYNLQISEKMGEGANREETIEPISIFNDEGRELWFTLNLNLLSNIGFENQYQIPVIIEHKSSNFPPYMENKNDHRLIISEISPTSVELNGDELEEKIIELRIKNESNDLFEDMRIVSYIENHSGQFLEINTYNEDEKLDSKGEETGTIRISIKSLNSLGDQIKYKVQLVLFDGRIQMDTKIINVVVKSN